MAQFRGFCTHGREIMRLRANPYIRDFFTIVVLMLVIFWPSPWYGIRDPIASTDIGKLA
jgi:hypothetical protein